MAYIEVLRATELWQQAGAYYVRIHAMMHEHHIPLHAEIDSHDAPDTKYIVVLSDGFPVATCRFYDLDEKSVMIGRVVVLQEFRGKGLGELVMREAEKWLVELGYEKAVLESRDVAVGFYKKLGYTEVDGTAYFVDPFTCVRMEKNLS